MAALHFSAAAGIGFEQASRIGDWSLQAGLAVLEHACQLFAEFVVAANYLLGEPASQVFAKLSNLCVQLVPHV